MEAFRQRMKNMNENNSRYLQSHGDHREMSSDSSGIREVSSTYCSGGDRVETSPSCTSKRFSSELRQGVVDDTPEETVKSLSGNREPPSPGNETVNDNARRSSQGSNKTVSPVSSRRASVKSLENTPTPDAGLQTASQNTDRIDHIDFPEKKGLDVEVSRETNTYGKCDEADSDSSIEFILENGSSSQKSKSPSTSSIIFCRESTSPPTRQRSVSGVVRRRTLSGEVRPPSLASSRTLSSTAHPPSLKQHTRKTPVDKSPLDSPLRVKSRATSSRTRASSPKSRASSSRTRASSPKSRASSSRTRASSPKSRASFFPRRSSGSSPLSSCRRISPNCSANNLRECRPVRSHSGSSPCSSRLRSPVRKPTGRRGELLDRIENKMATVRDDILVRNRQLESAMLRDPFTRLYHMNNRRDRDERRGRIQQYKHLEAAKERLLVDSDSDGAQRRRTRRELMFREHEELFARLSHPFPKRLSRPQTPTTPQRRRADDATFQRLYDEGEEWRAAREARQRRSKEAREEREAKELLRARIRARVEIQSPQYARSPQLRDKRVASIEQTLIQDPNKLRAFLSPRRMTKKEEKDVAWRLSHHGFVNAEKLAERKAKEELKACTFHPRTNSPSRSGRRHASRSSYDRDTFLSSTRRSPQAPLEVSPKRSSSSTQKRACEMLYLRAVKQRKRREELIEKADKEKRLFFLKGKLREDHHFSKRVEMDPSLADRFMASLAL